jgi:cysteinyl-tRNA synthetase
LEAARDGLERLYEKASFFGEMSVDIDSLNREPSQKVREQFLEFEQALADDLNTPKALAALHLGLKQARDNYDEMYLFLKSDEVLGLNFVEQGIEKFRQNQDFSSEFRKELSEREELKKNSKYKEADEIRKKIEAQGYHVDDTQDGVVVRKVR